MREVFESDFSSHVSRGTNSLISLVGVLSHACARVAGAVVARDSAVSGGLLPLQKSTSYNLDGCSQCPTGRRRTRRWGFRSGRRFPSCPRGGGRCEVFLSARSVIFTSKKSSAIFNTGNAIFTLLGKLCFAE